MAKAEKSTLTGIAEPVSHSGSRRRSAPLAALAGAVGGPTRDQVRVPFVCRSRRCSCRRRPAMAARRTKRAKAQPTRRACIAYRASTGQRCPRLALRAGWRGRLCLCRDHARGLAAVMAIVLSPAERERLALAPWNFVREAR
jgi:hypothetical protein